MTNKYQNNEQDRRLEVLEGHIGTLNSEMGNVQKCVSGIKTDLEWLKKTYWVIATASVGALIGVIISLFNK